jgi:hypothetical protein
MLGRMSTEKEALRAARANEQRAREVWDQRNARDAEAADQARAAPTARWDAAAERFLRGMKALGFPDAVVVREYRRGVFARRPEYAAWKLWTPDQDPDSRSIAVPWWVIIDGRLGHGSPEAVDLMYRFSGLRVSSLAEEILTTSLGVLEMMASRLDR